MNVSRGQVRLILAGTIAVMGMVLYVMMDPAEATPRLTLPEQRVVVRALMVAGEWDEAERRARRMLHEQDGPPSLACLLAEVLIGQGRAREALTLLEPIRVSERRADVVEMYGRALLAERQTGLGRLELESALRLEPGRLSAVVALVRSYLDEGDAETAADLLMPHAHEPTLIPLLAQLAIARADAALLAKLLEPVDAATVGCVLAMHSGRDAWVRRLIGPRDKTPRAALARAWLKRPNAEAAQKLVDTALDRVDDPMNSAKPLEPITDEVARLLAVARMRWPDDSIWDGLAVEAKAAPLSVTSESQWIATVTDPTTPLRSWDAAVAQLNARVGPASTAALVRASGRDSALAYCWLADLALQRGDAAEARRWIDRAQQQRPGSARVLRIMGELAPEQSQLGETWPGKLGR